MKQLDHNKLYRTREWDVRDYIWYEAKNLFYNKTENVSIQFLEMIDTIENELWYLPK